MVKEEKGKWLPAVQAYQKTKTTTAESKQWNK
jgi:hypothetical protein